MMSERKYARDMPQEVTCFDKSYRQWRIFERCCSYSKSLKAMIHIRVVVIIALVFEDRGYLQSLDPLAERLPCWPPDGDKC